MHPGATDDSDEFRGVSVAGVITDYLEPLFTKVTMSVTLWTDMITGCIS